MFPNGAFLFPTFWSVASLAAMLLRFCSFTRECIAPQVTPELFADLIGTSLELRGGLRSHIEEFYEYHGVIVVGTKCFILFPMTVVASLCLWQDG